MPVPKVQMRRMHAAEGESMRAIRFVVRAVGEVFIVAGSWVASLGLALTWISEE